MNQRSAFIYILFAAVLVLAAEIYPLSTLAMSTKQPREGLPKGPRKDTCPNDVTSETKPYKTNSISIFFTGDILSSLKPCGCSGGQLGGLDRRSAVLDTTGESARLIVDTGNLVETDSEQNLIKFNVMVQALNLLDYDLVNLTKTDLEIARNLHLLDIMASAFNLITPETEESNLLAAKFTKQFQLASTSLKVTVAAVDAQSDLENLTDLFPSQTDSKTTNILILNSCDEKILDFVTGTKLVDCVICPPDSDEAMILSAPDEKPIVVSLGRFGKYIGQLQIKTNAEIKDGLGYDFTIHPITENLPQNHSLIDLYRSYQLLVEQADLLETHPRFTLPNDLQYTGSSSCKLCHDYEYEKWSEKPHANAYSTLEKINSQYDPECITCHVVGFEYETGFISEQKSREDLKNVGCENCHGPGSEHIKSLGQEKTTSPQYTCTDCHTPEESIEYSGNEDAYFKKIIHWREPNASADVK